PATHIRRPIAPDPDKVGVRLSGVGARAPECEQRTLDLLLPEVCLVVLEVDGDTSPVILADRPNGVRVLVTAPVLGASLGRPDGGGAALEEDFGCLVDRPLGEVGRLAEEVPV